MLVDDVITAARRSANRWKLSGQRRDAGWRADFFLIVRSVARRDFGYSGSERD